MVPFDVLNKKDVNIVMHKIEENHQYEGRLPE